ncbi:lanthionine synthetase C family protein [Vallitalea sp.]|jgi:lantibiotic modifying enzyme|uniref:lanthionine synthetase C family protein n=1 Tax=Vallitalea sp. TaxID=1882829 RepID=UPI0025E718E6|nr:lanthionine synthetase C family protein [Vallitalea sp.]MCT4685811.1 lanthionine synthetase C family protein [Vallitalea sp.]
MKWSQVTDEKICNKIQQIVDEGAHRLVNPEQIQQDMLELIKIRKESGAEYIPWSPTDLARGYSGFCVMFGALDKANPQGGWDNIGHSYLQDIQKVIMKESIREFSLWTGLAGVIIAARALSRGGTRYGNFIKELNSFFIKSFPSIMQYMESRLEQGISLKEFDVIQGLSGIGRYVLCFIDEHDMKLAMEQILTYLIKVCEDKKYKGLVVPGWYVYSNRYTGYDSQYPNGYFNCGMSHGIPGVLALMSIAMMKGVEVSGQHEAIHKIAQWIMKWKENDEFGPLWPARITWEENLEEKAQNVVPREAWCYGGPGVARALWLSGIAVNNDEYKSVALETFRGTAMRPEEKWNIESDTFCHGRAGLLQMVQRMYSESGDKLIGELRDKLLEQVIDLWNKEALYGYQEKELSDKQDIGGLLDGAAGVFTVLIGLIQEQDTDWDLIFLIS